ncbi:MAG: hypothetical protein AAGB46_06050 [Verrucomicrobiota bacterium]
MSYQYIHTSAKRGLEPGQSGFCCVARHADIPQDLIRELEGLSQYDHLPNGVHPQISRHLKVDTRSGSYHILSQIRDAGADYSKRNNHIAHHLVFTEDEAYFLETEPATILLKWTRWRMRWEEPPRLLGEEDRFNPKDLKADYVQFENSPPQDYPTLLEPDGPHRLTFNIDAGEESLALFHYRNTLHHVEADRRWDCTFTTHLQANDNPSAFVWAAAQRDRALPYDLDFYPRPFSEETESQEETEGAETHPENESPASEYIDDEPPLEQDTSFLKVAPKVEVPKAFDRRKLKKPKAKWNEKKVSQLINGSIVAFAAIAIVGFIIYALQDDAPPPDDTTQTTQNTQPTQAPKAQARQRWNELSAKGELVAQLEVATQYAETLDRFGEPAQKRIINLLSELSNADAANPIPLDSTHLEIATVSASLDVDTFNLPDYQEFAPAIRIAPIYLKKPLEELAALGADISMIFDSLGSQQFDASAISLAVRQCRRVNRDRFSNDLPTKDQAIIDFFNAKQSLQNDARLKPLLEIQLPFGQTTTDAYIAFDSEGMLLRPEEKGYADYLQQLLQSFILPKFTRFEATSEYREALKFASDPALENPTEVAKAIHQTILVANPLGPQLKETWDAIETAWRETFIRSDLMEETLLSYAIETLETSRRQLADYQSHFTQKELADYRAYQQITEILTDLEISLSETPLSSQTWLIYKK